MEEPDSIQTETQREAAMGEMIHSLNRGGKAMTPDSFPVLVLRRRGCISFPYIHECASGVLQQISCVLRKLE
jgi:hypothetical protein